MKINDSGMPEELYWNSLFDIENIVNWLNLSDKLKIVEIGCGYGTFTLPLAASKPESNLIAFDIEPSMIDATYGKVANAKLSNVECILRDVLAKGTGLQAESIDAVLLFNILHFTERRVLLQEASRLLKKGGIAAIIHWRKDISTPRGPVAELRPDLEQILSASENLGFQLHHKSAVLEPYHWGMQLIKGDMA